MTIALEKLDYEMDALEPFISRRTIEFHYGQHLKTYVNNANELIKGTIFENESLEKIVRTSVGPVFNNVAQAFNHTFYFKCLCPRSQVGLVPLNLSEKISEDFGSFDEFKKEFTISAMSCFGSGWTWLVQNTFTGKLSIMNTANADNPITLGYNLLLCLDVWEHAYYLDYQNRRKEYVNEFFNYINWHFVASNLGQINLQDTEAHN